MGAVGWKLGRIKPSFKRRCTEHLRRGRQARQTHRRRKALGRALHQLRGLRDTLFYSPRRPRRRAICIPKMLWQHRRLFRRVLLSGA